MTLPYESASQIILGSQLISKSAEANREGRKNRRCGCQGDARRIQRNIRPRRLHAMDWIMPAPSPIPQERMAISGMLVDWRGLRERIGR